MNENGHQLLRKVLLINSHDERCFKSRVTFFQSMKSQIDYFLLLLFVRPLCQLVPASN